MKTSQIKTFLSVVRNGSVLASLEDELGVELFERSGNQLHLTAIGQSILTDCRRFDQVASQIRARCQHHLSGAESVLRIARDDAIPEEIRADPAGRWWHGHVASVREYAPVVGDRR